MAIEDTNVKPAAEKAATKTAPKAPEKQVEETQQEEVKKPTLAELVEHSRKTFQKAKEKKEKADLDELAKKIK